MSQQGQQVFSDRYELLRHIARGGMAQVYLAKDLLLDRRVAVKVLFPELSVDLSFVERFRREAQAAANLSHPNIVSIYDWGQGERTYFIVMEYVDGDTLSSVIRNGPLEPDRAAAIGAEVANALGFAHRHGVIHRDVKPGNVLIDRSGQVKVTDFGIARAVGTQEGLTQTGAVMGTATYFSPEQAQGQAVDARSDVYSLGVVLYEMAVGKPPFSGDNPLSIAYKHVREQPPRPSEANPAVPAAFEAVILKALTKEPEGRYQTADELRADLLRFERGEPVLAAEASAVAAGAAAATRVQTRLQSRYDDPTAAVARTTAAIPAARQRSDTPRRRVWPWVAVVAVIIAALVALLLIATRPSTKSAAIPNDLVGKQAAAAQTELRQQGFTNVSTREQAGSSAPVGSVVSVNPAGGTTIKVNQPVVLTVSGGVRVPKVVGLTYQEAEARFEGAGLNYLLKGQNSNTVPVNQVISQTPAAGTKVKKGAAITVYYSLGRAPVTIPTGLTGQDPTTVGDQLGLLHLKTTTQREASTTVDIGLVTRTDPPEGTKVAEGKTVTIYISNGITVPNVVNSQLATAQGNLQGLAVTTNYQPVSSPAENNVVLGQSLAPNQQVNPGTSIALTVGQYTAPSTTTTTTTPTTTTTTTTTTPTSHTTATT